MGQRQTMHGCRIEARGLLNEGEDAVDRRKFAESAYFEDLQVGQTFYIPSRTQTDALFAAFQLASGDHHPLHYDVEYCKQRGYPGLLAHGFQLVRLSYLPSHLPGLNSFERAFARWIPLLRRRAGVVARRT